MLGGTENYYFGGATSTKNDVWSSADGKTWTQVTAKAAWSPRAYHQAAVLGNKIYVFGGGNYVPKYHAVNDVWSSEDGVNWTQVTDAAAWSPRLWFSTAVYRDKLWVLGGWSNNPSKNWGDAWYSADGKTWKELKTETKSSMELRGIMCKSRDERRDCHMQIGAFWLQAGVALKVLNQSNSLYYYHTMIRLNNFISFFKFARTIKKSRK